MGLLVIVRTKNIVAVDDYDVGILTARVYVYLELPVSILYGEKFLESTRSRTGSGVNISQIIIHVWRPRGAQSSQCIGKYGCPVFVHV